MKFEVQEVLGDSVIGVWKNGDLESRMDALNVCLKFKVMEGFLKNSGGRDKNKEMIESILYFKKLFLIQWKMGFYVFMAIAYPCSTVFTLKCISVYIYLHSNVLFIQDEQGNELFKLSKFFR